MFPETMAFGCKSLACRWLAGANQEILFATATSLHCQGIVAKFHALSRTTFNACADCNANPLIGPSCRRSFACRSFGAHSSAFQREARTKLPAKRWPHLFGTGTESHNWSSTRCPRSPSQDLSCLLKERNDEIP